MNRKERRKSKKAVLLAAFMLIAQGLFPAQSYAATPDVGTDEAAYVNMDYYGVISDISVVKSCSTNGLTKFKDYGEYESVTNMSGYEKPALSADGVSWNLEPKTAFDRFYYNCVLKKDALILPWSFDLSYKLNGVPVKAETLAGASGLVEIDIHAKPDPRADDYYKNNMLLQIAAYINTEEAYSIEAPGSQLQSAGTYKAAVFAAMPGEDVNYAIRIGTDCFETDGITMMMFPATLKQMEELKKLKEAEEKIGDSAEAIYNGMDSIFGTMEGMKTGLAGLKEGIKEANDARSVFSSGKEDMYKDADQAMDDLSSAGESIEGLSEDFKASRDLIKSLNTEISSMIAILEEFNGPLSDTSNSVRNMQTDLVQMSKVLNSLDKNLAAVLMQLGTSGGGAFISETISLGNTSVEVIDITRKLLTDLDELSGSLGEYEYEMTGILDDCEELSEEISQGINSTVTYLDHTKTLFQDSGEILDSATEKSLESLIDILDKSLTGMGDISTLRYANKKIKNTIDNELDEFENENHFLNIDPEAGFVSFTSDRNPPPSSIQVILRTQEIRMDNSTNLEVDMETEKADIGLWGRIEALLEKIIDIFK